MILLYTGASLPDQPQPQAQLSLGGFVSSTQVQNAQLGNIFSDISIGDYNRSTIFTRMLVLKNTTGSTINNLSIYTELVSDQFELKIAGVLPAIDVQCNNREYFEQLINGNSLPFQSTLSVCDEESPITTTNFEADKIIGIWISLSRKNNSQPLFNNTITEEAISQLRTQTGYISTEFKLKIVY